MTTPLRTTRIRHLAQFAVLPVLFSSPAFAADPQPRRWDVTVKEAAGIRRFGYPVNVVIPLREPVPDAEHFRLLDNGKPVAAQVRPAGGRAVALDFNVNHAPLETRSYVLEHDPSRSAEPSRK